MHTSKLTNRFLAAVLAIGTSAAQGQARAATAAADAPGAEAGKPATTETGVPGQPAQPAKAGGQGKPLTPEQERAGELRKKDAVLREREAAMRERDALQRAARGIEGKGGDPFGGGAGGFGVAGGNMQGMKSVFARSGMAVDAVAVIGTDAMEENVEAEWKEDLNVMDKLLRDKLTGGGELPAVVMGIKISTLGLRTGPMYVEGAGVVLNGFVNIPLAPAAADKAPATRERASAWERTKRELKGNVPGGAMMGEQPVMEFDQARLDALVDAIVKILPEASNFRHLKENESVFVSLTGVDEAGAPLRLTLKAKKSDIDEASRSGISPETFKQRVARRVN